MPAALRQRYDRRSLVALACLGGVYLLVGLAFPQLIDLDAPMDWLLAFLWTFMSAMLCQAPEARRDLPLVAVAFVGGLVIEWWGTTTELWTYYTAERPPLWILPAWPVATLANERITQTLEALAPPGRGSRWPAIATFLAFTVVMALFSQPSWHILSTRCVLLLMLAVSLSVQDGRRELLLFAAGSALGVGLEYWGTSRWCWRYYTLEEPPWQAVFAHGFASISFLRGTQALAALARLLGRRPAPDAGFS